MPLLALSFIAGLGLGWNHFRMYHRMLEYLMEKPEATPFKSLALKVGMIRHFFTFGAGVCLIGGARLDPSALCGGLLFATAVYRARLFRGESTFKEAGAK